MAQLMKDTYMEQIAGELQRTLQLIPEDHVKQLADKLLQAERVFVAGSGRSGLMMRAFAMRLMHLGLTVYVVGETVTPGIAAEDLLVIGSGSGETKSLASMAGKAKNVGADIALVTIVPESTIGQLAHVVVPVPAATKDSNDERSSVQPMGSLFEQSLLLILDAIILRIMAVTKLDGPAMFGRHANLE
jgi:6-phospho-3-hexuloisomerase